jgi:hypothetical protein
MHYFATLSICAVHVLNEIFSRSHQEGLKKAMKNLSIDRVPAARMEVHSVTATLTRLVGWISVHW